MIKVLFIDISRQKKDIRINDFKKLEHEFKKNLWNS